MKIWATSNNVLGKLVTTFPGKKIAHKPMHARDQTFMILYSSTQTLCSKETAILIDQAPGRGVQDK